VLLLRSKNHRLFDALAEIRTRYTPGTSQKRYHLSQLGQFDRYRVKMCGAAGAGDRVV
jgi:hypothetical protein